MGRSLGKNFGNSLTRGTDSIGGISESKSFTLTIWYKHDLKIILKAFKIDMIRPVGIDFPTFHYKKLLILKVKLHQPRSTIY